MTDRKRSEFGFSNIRFVPDAMLRDAPERFPLNPHRATCYYCAPFSMELRLQLHHHLAHQKFVLIREGDDWRQEFNTLEDAMKVAVTLVSGAVPLFELDEAGNVVLESDIHTAAYRLDGLTPQ